MRRPAFAVFSTIACLILCSGCDQLYPSCPTPLWTSPQARASVAQYEDWLVRWRRSATNNLWASRITPSRILDRSYSDLIFITDRRADPRSGLSVVQIRATGRTYYTIGRSQALYEPVFSEGLAPFQGGYIDASGRYVIAPRFEYENAFDRGVAAVSRWDTVRHTRVWMLLHKDGSTETLDPSILYIRGFSGDLAVFGTWPRRTEGFLDHSGRIVIPATFLKADAFCASGTAAVKTSSGWGVIDQRGKFIVAPNYDGVHCFAHGLAAAKRGSWGFINTLGTFVVPPQFDDLGDFSEGLAPFSRYSWPYGTPPAGAETVYVAASREIRQGYVDATGAIVIPAQWRYANPFQFGIAKVGTRNKRINWNYPFYICWAYVDKTGKTIAADSQPEDSLNY
jgi:WG containing repeat